MNIGNFLLIGAGALTLTACNEPRIKTANYGYSYINSTETFISTQRFVGELYILKLTDEGPILEPLDKEIIVADSDLRHNASVNLENSRVSGAKIDVVKAGKVEASGSAVFEAKVVAQKAQVRRMSGSVASNKIEELYEANWSPETTIKTLRAEEVLRDDTYYVLVSGAGLAENLELSHGAPDGTTNGFSLTIDGKEISGVKISNRRFFKCQKSDVDRPSCTAAITVYDANLISVGGAKKLNVFPTRAVKPSIITEAFRRAFSG